MINSEEAKNKDEIRRLKQLIAKNPEDLDSYIQLGKVYNQIGNEIESFSTFKKASKLFPNSGTPLVELGNVYFDQEKYADAYHAYQKAADIDPNNTDAWLGMCEVYNVYGEVEESIELCHKALEADPDDPRTLISILHYLVLSKDYIRAENLGKKLQRRKDLDDKSKDLKNYYMGVLYIKMKLYRAAIPYFTQITSESKIYGPALHNLAVAYSDNGDFKASKIKFEELFNSTDKKLDPIQIDSKAWINYGIMLEKSGNYQEAYEKYQKANQLQNNSWPYLESMKRLLIENKPLDKENKDDKNQLSNKIFASTLGKLKYALYLGCVIPNRYPMVEAATHMFLDEIGVQVDEMDGAGCCPAPGVFRSFDVPTWLTLAARNITIAQDQNDDLLTMCNGCYGTLLEADHIIKHDSDKKQMVNKHLSKVGREFKGTSQIKHIVEVMYKDIGTENLKHFIKRKWNLDVAVHYGCHILKPVETKPWGGEFEDPKFFDELVELTGAKSLPYKDKMMCCGAGGGVRSCVKEVSLDFTFAKLKAMREAGAQAIIVCCPFCYLQFDLGQVEINSIFKDEIDEPFKIPVIYITQLFDYAFGKDPYRYGLMRPNSPKGTPPFIPTESIFENYYEEP